MIGRNITATALVLAFAAAGAVAGKPRGAVECSELNWSPEVLAQNPDIALACQGVYQKDGKLYAKATIEVVRVQGSTLKFRTVRNDGSVGPRRSVKLGKNWRVRLDGREYLLGELSPGQRLSIYLPEDRFSLTVLDSSDASATAIERDDD